MSNYRNFLSTSALALGLVSVLAAGHAQAASVANQNLDTYFTGMTLSPVPGFPMYTANLIQSTPTFTDSHGVVHVNGSVVGTLGNCVFKVTSGADTGDYIYEEKLTTGKVSGEPSADFGGDLAAFDVNFNLVGLGFTGKAGYNFSGIPGLGGTAPASTYFSGVTTSLGQLDWTSTDSAISWTSGASLTFFYESTDAPDDDGAYQCQDGIQGQATSYAPSTVTLVPVPAAASMALTALAGLAGLGLLRRRMATA